MLHLVDGFTRKSDTAVFRLMPNQKLESSSLVIKAFVSSYFSCKRKGNDSKSADEVLLEKTVAAAPACEVVMV